MYDVNPLSLKLHLADIDRQFAGTARPPALSGRLPGVLGLLRSLALWTLGTCERRSESSEGSFNRCPGTAEVGTRAVQDLELLTTHSDHRRSNVASAKGRTSTPPLELACVRR